MSCQHSEAKRKVQKSINDEKGRTNVAMDESFELEQLELAQLTERLTYLNTIIARRYAVGAFFYSEGTSERDGLDNGHTWIINHVKDARNRIIKRIQILGQKSGSPTEITYTTVGQVLQQPVNDHGLFQEPERPADTTTRQLWPGKDAHGVMERIVSWDGQPDPNIDPAWSVSASVKATVRYLYKLNLN
ncbi:hypothetical protein B0T21DRAFT_351788 [Apiosordaria backusii]|uniref:Uncharacterized protein n=1 Tax=Apiosordaria backusii TaxID=314023 RepID=A0AA40AND0_9PEZI|nr:hypothetical protein B0T21DRAFT_351788 [Apiosordaria backusii]